MADEKSRATEKGPRAEKGPAPRAARRIDSLGGACCGCGAETGSRKACCACGEQGGGILRA